MKRIMIEPEKCEGCLSCNLACMQAHRLSEGTLYDLNLQDQLNETRNFILQDKKQGYKPLFCRHCEEPACVMSCMSGALTQDQETGHVVYNGDQCGSCYMCVMNCPFGVLKTDEQTQQKIIKCDFCENLDTPSCVTACPTGAITVREV